MNLTGIPNWEAKYEAVQALLALTARHLDRLTTAPGPQSRQVAALYLARCRRLLLGMDTLRQEGLIDVSSVLLLRPLFEGWLTGMWVLLAGQDALDIVMAAYATDIERLNRMANLGMTGLPEVVEPTSGPNMEQLANTVGRLLLEAGDEGGPTLRFAYNLVYRGESGRNVHGGFGTVADHMTDSGTYFGVREVREEPGDGTGSVLWGAVLLAVLTRHVFLRFGLSFDALDSLSLPFQDLLDDYVD